MRRLALEDAPSVAVDSAPTISGGLRACRSAPRKANDTLAVCEAFYDIVCVTMCVNIFRCYFIW